MTAHCRNRCRKDGDVVGKADDREQVGHRVEWQDEVGERSKQDGADALRCCGVERAIEARNDITRKGQLCEGPLEYGPEALLHLCRTLFRLGFLARQKDVTILDVVHRLLTRSSLTIWWRFGRFQWLALSMKAASLKSSSVSPLAEWVE